MVIAFHVKRLPACLLRQEHFLLRGTRLNHRSRGLRPDRVLTEIQMKLRTIAASLLLAGLTRVANAETVDLALSLVIDVSGSVSTSEYNLQMDGYASAFRNATIQNNMLSGANRATAINVVFFASNAYTTALDSFTILRSADDINSFASILADFARPGSGGTSVHNGTNRAIDLLLAATAAGGALEGTGNLIIDVSGDGTSGTTSSRTARDRAAAAGIVINGLPIGGTSITNFYTQSVITPDGFVQPANDFDDFAAAIATKLDLETGSIDPVPEVPEPSTWALMLAGAAIVWRAARRRPAID